LLMIIFPLHWICSWGFVWCRWLQMTNDPNFDYHLHSIDRDALSHLEDLTLEHDLSDARNVTFHFVSVISLFLGFQS
jgi:hypothetical protein